MLGTLKNSESISVHLGKILSGRHTISLIAYESRPIVTPQRSSGAAAVAAGKSAAHRRASENNWLAPVRKATLR